MSLFPRFEGLSPPRYLIRFDDICPTMNWTTWELVEALLIKHGVRPILAVVPDNHDPKLIIDPPRADFWDRVRQWQARGWAIGMHGYQHRYVNCEAGMLGVNLQSEFAGLSYEEQMNKLRAGLSIFAREGIQADCWVAPGHSFDKVTVRALSNLGISLISDGFALRPYRDDNGSRWVPQQLAQIRPMPFGVWTFCYHTNAMSETDIARFSTELIRLSPRMISLAESEKLATQKRGPGDTMVAVIRRLIFSARRLLSKLS